MREIRVGIAGSVGRGRAFFTPLIENPHATITALCDLKEN